MLFRSDAAANVLTGAMSLTDKLAGVESGALPSNAALTKPKPRRVSFAQNEEAISDEPSKKRLGPLLCVSGPPR